jgi:actin-related protein
MLPGIQSRIEIELKGLIKEKMKGELRFPLLIRDTLFRNSSYIGAKMLSSCYYKDYINYWISKKEWEECGTKIIDEKTKFIL